MSRLTLLLLGAPRIERDDTPITVDTRKAIALLAYLAMTGGHHARDTLATLLWPKSNQARGRSALRRTLSVLKAALGAGWLDVTRETVGLNRGDGIWLDVDQFHRRLAECQTHGHPPDEACPACLILLTEVVELYRDDFLAGFTLRDSVDFDDWQSFQAESLRRDLASALARLVYCHAERGEFESAIAYTRRWLSLDPLSEPAHRYLMQLYARVGQRAAALRQYQECVRVLERDLGVAPQPETTALYERMRTDEEAIAAPSLRFFPRHNLPVPPTPFVGREEELAEIAALLANPACRLLTLVGPGGIGKTRLALQAALREAEAGTFAQVILVALAPLRAPDVLVPATADALGFPIGGKDDPRVQLLNYLREKEVLLVMDNLEHLLEGAGLLSDILSHAPRIKILGTSRERLNLQGEWVFPVQGMRFPGAELIKTVESYSAVQLFLQSAQRTQASFALSLSEIPHVIRICQQVEGVPLALELAASWVPVLSSSEIAHEIERDLGALSTPLRDVPVRHRSLRAVFEHSWQLLSGEEQRALTGLTAFRAGFRRDAAQQVAGASLPLLSALLDKSLLRRTASGRYDLHELVRRFATEKLTEDWRLEIANRHSAYFTAFLHQRESHLKGARQKKALQEIGFEFENVRTAWQWAIARKKAEQIARSLDSLALFYELRGRFQGGKDAFEQAATDLAGTDVVRGKLLTRWGRFCHTLGQYEEAERLLHQGLSIAQTLDDRAEVAYCLLNLGIVAEARGDYAEARRLDQESLAIRRAIGDQWGTVRSLLWLSSTHDSLGEYAETRRLLQEALSICRALEDQAGTARTLDHLAGVAWNLGEYEEAQQFLQESLAIQRRFGNQPAIAFALNNLGCIAIDLGKHAEARRLLEESIAIIREMGDPVRIGVPLGSLGDMAYAQKEYGEAQRCYQESLAAFEKTGVQGRPIAFVHNKLGLVACELGEFGKSRAHFRQALEIATSTRADPLTLDTLVGAATLLANEGKRERAVELLSLILHHPAGERETHEHAARLQARLESGLPCQVVKSAQARGMTKQLKEVAKELLSEMEQEGGPALGDYGSA